MVLRDGVDPYFTLHPNDTLRPATAPFFSVLDEAKNDKNDFDGSLEQPPTSAAPPPLHGPRISAP